MDTTLILQMVKDNLNIRSNVKDSPLTAKINGIVAELQDEQGLVLNSADPYQLLFIVDYVTWRYQNPNGDMPRHLKYRLNNLIIHVGSANLRVDGIETVAVLPEVPSQYTVYILSTDGSKQMYINGAWANVDMVNGSWVVV